MAGHLLLHSMEGVDASSLIHNAKNQKLSKEHDVGESENRISNLTDTIAQHILSFLPTKDAAKTSILSKRWTYLWLSIPVLDFHDGANHYSDSDEPPYKRKHFMDIVERVLLLRDYSTITNFSLTCNVLYDSTRINTWISAVVKCKVQVLNIRLYKIREPFILPCCLFTCESLQELKLNIYYPLKLPSFVSFSSLKILTLIRIVFPDDHSAQMLFKVCSILEELHLISCNSSSILEAELMACYSDRKIDYRAFKLLRGLSNAKSLKLDQFAVKALDDELVAHLPVFNSLTRVHFDWVVLFYSRQVLLSMLQKFPCLSSLKFEGLSFMFRYFGTYDWTLDPVPGCFLTHLKTIEISMFCGSEIELHAVRILLKSATVLEKIVISFNPWELKDADGLKKQQEAHEQILSFPRASLNCLIAISCPPKEKKRLEFFL
ncbi:fbd-associated f-box protein [Quercus suber]|uniref:Fbd-associated f-box protein n=1 Tax=Quercus suber TaxID=58331 RepID=A0AAW0M397_QUESU